MRLDPSAPTIDVRDPDCIRERCPILVAHRGGVIGPGAPENSLAAIQLAAVDGYDMVELDVRMAKDGEPVLFHGTAGRGLSVDCGVEDSLEDLTSEELRQVRYRASDEPIATLADALALCASVKLGVMLDIKQAGSEGYLGRISDLLREHDLGAATVTISGDPSVQQYLADQVLSPVSKKDYRRALHGHRVSLRGQFWFGWAAELPNEGVSRLQACGAFTLVSINTFHYPSHAHHALARQDIRRLLAAGADGFQIDSVYGDCFR